MSDNHYHDPTQPNDKEPRGDSWEQEPFAPYDDPFINPEGTGTPLTGEPPAYQAPPPVPQNPPADEPDFAAPPQANDYAKPPAAESEPPAPQQEKAQPLPEAETPPPAPRRRGRVARFHEGMERSVPDTQPVLRQAEPGERYSGARTATPQAGGPPRRPLPEAPRSSVQDNFNPPARGNGTLRPQAPQARPRPVDSRPQGDGYGWPKPTDQPPMREPYDGGRPPRRGRGLLIFIIILIVLGGAFAGIWLPNWDSMEGGIGETMSSVQTALKDLIAPEEIIIYSFSVEPSTATAPVELSIVIRASAATETLRIIDDAGKTVLQKNLTDQDRLLQVVTKNSDGNYIWKLRRTFDSAYTGSLTVQAMDRDGVWDEAGQLQQAVSIEPPMVFDPPVQDFLCSTAEDIVPVTVSFSVVTSLDVQAVRVVNDYGDEIAKLTINTAGLNMTETGDTRVWTLEGTISEPYAGSLYVGYEMIVGEGFTQSDYKTDVEYVPAPIPEDTAEPAAEPTPGNLLEPDPAVEPTAEASAEPAAEPTAEPTATPTPAPSPTPTPEPTEEPEPTPTPGPTLMPLLGAAADAEGISLKTTIYEGTSKTSSYTRTELVNMLDSAKYAIWEQSGVLTFRGGPLRQNAAYGTVEIDKGKMSVYWQVPVEGRMRMSGNDLYGVGWPGQAAIVKWPMEVRQLLDISDAMKETVALKEVIIGAQNGKLYFLNLITGEYTRDPIEVDWPSNGAVSVNTDGSPIVTFGQFYSIKSDKSRLDNGLHVYSLLSNRQLTLVDGRQNPTQTNYSGFSGAPLFDKISGTMIVGGQNGVFYLADLGTEFDYLADSLSISPKYYRYIWNAPGQDEKTTNIDGSVAMYGPYAYFGDKEGVLQCVDVNTLTSVWAVRTGDQIECTAALEMSTAGDGVALYIGNTIANQGRNGVASIFRYDALSGKKIWQFDVPDLSYDSNDPVGIYASPVVGLKNISELVFFTATNGDKDSTLYALNKADGSVKWAVPFTSPTESSPVAVYNAAGDAWIIQGVLDGRLYMLEASSGRIVDTLQLEGGLLASPAVYLDNLIISTTGQDPSYIYAIALE
ncbi:MAG: PQQ-binding-like beta-propeller repeat protein [Clostridiales bacterium]|nr:PQQ-binding-like beta-propeller repeat protein [Clostridiales bacterium]